MRDDANEMDAAAVLAGTVVTAVGALIGAFGLSGSPDNPAAVVGFGGLVLFIGIGPSTSRSSSANRISSSATQIRGAGKEHPPIRVWRQGADRFAPAVRRCG